ncbi:alpha/beta hydrolase [Aliiroseovarius sp.]|uniref:alpha/beta fold hydrolase n=1 Tax=Aliiroseovarius sp. TaxID=1872442 RepID=UPI00261EE3B9|nr:alpha/beta hydrolase [Aliiroseovarius sp.]
MRLRVGLWPGPVGDACPEGAKGTVLLIPGRTEYIEKYGPAAGDLARRGFATLVIDVRGQGLADRADRDHNLGHVDHFDEYQLDIQAMVAAAGALSLPEPYYMLGHSMGGCIGLRALYNGVPVKAAGFSAPMWGIQLPPHERPIAWVLSWMTHKTRAGRFYAPHSQQQTYVLANPFEGNNLTTDRAMYEFMQRQARAHPELCLGGPSLTWLHAALREMAALSRLPAPAQPAVTFLGSEEKIVTHSAIRRRMAGWSNGILEEIKGAEHEVLMEGPELRGRCYDACAALFSAHR